MPCVVDLDQKTIVRNFEHHVPLLGDVGCFCQNARPKIKAVRAEGLDTYRTSDAD